jgi:hypothetical protein
MATAQEVVSAGAAEITEPIAETTISQPSGETTSTATPTVQPTVPATASQPAKVNLDGLEDFRKYKSARDKQAEEYRQQLARYAQETATLRQAQEQAALQNLKVQLDSTDDDTQRQNYIKQMAAIEARGMYEQERLWGQHVAERVQAEGLDLADFNPLKYRGNEGALVFERDLALKTKAKLQDEIKATREAASPDTIAKLVQAELAKALRAKGVDASTDASAPGATVDTDAAWQRDLALHQTGRMSNEEFLKRWRDKV